MATAIFSGGNLPFCGKVVGRGKEADAHIIAGEFSRAAVVVVMTRQAWECR